MIGVMCIGLHSCIFMFTPMAAAAMRYVAASILSGMTVKFT